MSQDERLPKQTDTVSPVPDPGALMKGTMDELRRAIDTKHAIGEPLVFENVTVIPLLSVGFAFGSGGGGGAGQDPRGRPGQGGGGGGAGGGGIKPVGVIIIDADGARLEAIPQPTSGMERLGTAIASTLERRSERKAGGPDSE
jgi:uncharacterized spore protein YtfJ